MREGRFLGVVEEAVVEAQLVFDFRRIVDGLKEVGLGGKSIDATKKGIGTYPYVTASPPLKTENPFAAG
ncbi:Adenylosuccinate synthase [Stygiomarasmius scandens]|uniref:Adenylosuccinate synthase n=1 Tax=Marasmiellus scandens TaxID=2682957 RepID=A0ABR1IY20_9AGAR